MKFFSKFFIFSTLFFQYIIFSRILCNAKPRSLAHKNISVKIYESFFNRAKIIMLHIFGAICRVYKKIVRAHESSKGARGGEGAQTRRWIMKSRERCATGGGGEGKIRRRVQIRHQRAVELHQRAYNRRCAQVSHAPRTNNAQTKPI